MFDGGCSCKTFFEILFWVCPTPIGWGLVGGFYSWLYERVLDLEVVNCEVEK